ncbi:hypothetical protein ACFV0C_22485 [Streptomyces sp. NPDC059568]|uniref:hypothetical protein n=1 Tax=Streptomyces sp. NPDC059568 TaxID=3346868 RepID=UPI00368A3B0B
MTQPITAVEAKQVLSPHLEKISGCIDQGWKRWRALVDGDAELGLILSNRSRASIVYDCIRYEATMAFHGKGEVHVSEKRGVTLLTFSDKIVLRFKKFRDDKMRTSGIPTQQSKAFAAQVLPGMEELTHLVAGYLPDDTGIGLHLAAITCSLDDDQLWVLDLDLGFDQAVPATPVPLATGQDQTDTIVRPRSTDRDQGQAASEER